MKPWSQSVHFLKLLREHEIFGPVLWKKWGFSRNLTYFYFLLWPSFTWNWRKNGGFFFYDILASKMKLADGFIILRGIKLWNRQSWSGKKMKLTARGFAAAVSFIFFPTDSGRFHNFSPFKAWNRSQFHFWAEKADNKIASFIQFHVKQTQKKRLFPY